MIMEQLSGWRSQESWLNHETDLNQRVNLKDDLSIFVSGDIS